jgi:hypothetical protein
MADDHEVVSAASSMSAPPVDPLVDTSRDQVTGLISPTWQINGQHP